MNPFSRMVAMRYLLMQVRRSGKYHRISMVLAAAWIALSVAEHYLLRSHNLTVQEVMSRFSVPVELVRIVVVVVLVGLETFLRIVRISTIFTTISIYGLFIGSAAMVIALSVMSGFESDLRGKILGAHAHILVTTPDRAFVDYQATRDKIAHLPGVTGATPYLSNEVMIGSQSNLSGVVLKGIDPATVGQVTDLVRNIDVGELQFLVQPEKLRLLGGPPLFNDPDLTPSPSPSPSPSNTWPPEGVVHFRPADSHGHALPDLDKPSLERRVVPGVIVGRELAKNLRLYLGDDVKVVCPVCGIGPTGPVPKSKPFRVAAVFYSGYYEYDSKYLYMSIPAAQKFLGLEDEVTGIELKVVDSDRTEPVVAAIQRTLGPGYEVQDWKELNRNLFSALKLEKILMFIVLCFIILVAAFSIIANGIMLVTEKGREIAILKSMGASDGAILTVFMILGLYIGVFGTGLGIVAGVGACLALGHFGLPLDPEVYYFTQLPVRLNPGEIVAVAGAAIVIALLATLYPAWLAGRLRPVEGLREGHQ